MGDHQRVFKRYPLPTPMDLHKQELSARITGTFSSKLRSLSAFTLREIQELVTRRDLAAERCGDGRDRVARELRELEHKTPALFAAGRASLESATLLLFEEASWPPRWQEVEPAVRHHLIYRDCQHFDRNPFGIMPRKLPHKYKTESKPISKQQ